MARVRTRVAATALPCAAILSGLFDAPAGTRGVWMTDGYGRIPDIRARSVAVHDVTRTTCVRSGRLDHAGPVLRRRDIQSTEGGRAMRLREAGAAHPVRAGRIATLPERCLTGTAGTAPEVFAAFAEAMDAHYAFFDLHGVDWPARVDAARPRVLPSVPEGALFDPMAGILGGPDDGHLALRGRVGGLDRIAAPGRSRMARAVMEGRRACRPPPGFRFRDTHWNDRVLRDVPGGRGTIGAGGRAVRFGEATGGAFSDVLDRPLPDGWNLDLSTEVHLDARQRGREPHRRHATVAKGCRMPNA